MIFTYKPTFRHSRSQLHFCILTTLFLVISFPLVYGQTHADSLKKINIKQNKEIRIVTDSSRSELQKKHMNASGKFYKSVKTRANKNFFSRQLYPLLFKKPPVVVTPQADSGSEIIPFQNDKGKFIRSVRIYKADVFGGSVFDTTEVSAYWLDRTLNSVHFNTRDAVIKSYLQFKEGDRLNPVELSDNERLIRQSAIFEDARFIINSKPGNDTVDIVLVVRDVFPVGFDLKIRNANSSSVRIYNRNIIGFGQHLEQSFEINPAGSPVIYLSEGAYRIRNIKRTFTDALIQWQSKPEINRISLQLSRPFISPETRFGGGLNIQRARTRLIPDNNESATNLKYSVYDLWGGYSTIINRFRTPAFERSVFAITGRYYNINHMNTPSVVVQSLNPAVSVNRYTGALSLIKSGYYRNNMVYGFGQTEDIPTGHLAQLTMGYETSILYKRLYSGIKILSGELLNKGGFIYSWFESGGYWSGGKIADGVLGLGAEYISPLYKSGTYRIRSFGSLSFKTGINRNSPVGLPVTNNRFSETFHNFNISGNQRLTARAETVIFTPYYLLGFRFAAFTFVEAAMVVTSGDFIMNGNIYPAIGLGFRIKNENLAFSTFQLGLTWYGRADINGNNLMFGFNDLPQINALKFDIEAPRK